MQVLSLSMLKAFSFSYLHQLFSDFSESLLFLLPNCCSQLCAEADWDLFHSLLCTGVRSKSSDKEALLNFLQHANGKALNQYLAAAKLRNIPYVRFIELFFLSIVGFPPETNDIFLLAAKVCEHLLLYIIFYFCIILYHCSHQCPCASKPDHHTYSVMNLYNNEQNII